MKPEDIFLGQTYRGGKHNELRTVVGWGASLDYVCYGLTRERLPLGGFVKTKCVSRKAFAKWATAYSHSGWTVESDAADRLSQEGEFIELDFGGDRYTRYGKGVTLQETTCLRQPWMDSRVWEGKLRAFLEKQPPEMGIYTDRFKSGDSHRLIHTVAVKLRLMKEFADA